MRRFLGLICVGVISATMLAGCSNELSRADACTKLVARDSTFHTMVTFRDIEQYDSLHAGYVKMNEELSTKAPEPMRGYIQNLSGREELLLADRDSIWQDAEALAVDVAKLHGFDRNIFCSS